MVAAKRYAQHAWSCDVTERCAHFTEFNRCLNGLENLTVARGDLYEAAGNRRFDRIVAHPPYIPAPTSDKRKLFFRDGGADGEQILQRIVEGLPEHLAADGRFYCVTLATDRENESFEQRIRRWLGPAQSEFDIVLVASEIKRKPEEIIAGIVARGWMSRLSPTVALYEELKVTAMFYGAVMIHRKAEERPAATGRALRSLKARPDVMEWLFEWETAAVRAGFGAMLLQSRPTPSPDFKMIVTHTPESEGLIPTAFGIEIRIPVRCRRGLPAVVSRGAGSVHRIEDDRRDIRGDESSRGSGSEHVIRRVR